MMDFEEMQVIWDSQNERALYALDTDGLHESVRRRSRRLGRRVTIDELGMILISLVVAGDQAAQPLFEGTDRYRYVGALLFLGVAAYVLLGRLRRLRRERGFDASLVGDLERAIHRVDCQIWRARTFLWWFLLPAAAIVLLSFAQTDGRDHPWSWILVALSFFLGYGVVQFGLRRCLLPARRELEALRAKLFEDS